MVIVGLGLASIVGAIFFIWLGVRRLHASWRQKRARDDDQRAPRRDPEQQR
jgi:threonine/homoserine/homoserine lactone efflux protein